MTGNETSKRTNDRRDMNHDNDPLDELLEKMKRENNVLRKLIDKIKRKKEKSGRNHTNE